MSNIQEKQFDYSVVDSETAEYLRKKEQNIKRAVSRAAYEIGKELVDVHDKIVGENQYSKNTFKDWCKALGVSTPYDYMNYYKSFASKDILPTNADELPIEVIAILSSSQAPQELKEQIRSGEITKVKEMKELRKKLLAEQRQKKQLQSQIEELKNREPEVEYKEVIPDDYNDIKQKAERLEEMYSSVAEEKDSIEEHMESLKKEVEANKKSAKKYDELQKQISNLKDTKDDLARQVRATTELSGLIQKIEDMLKDELAPIKYSRAIAEQRDDEIVINNLNEIVGRVYDWCQEMYDIIESDQKTKHVEVVN